MVILPDNLRYSLLNELSADITKAVSLQIGVILLSL